MPEISSSNYIRCILGSGSVVPSDSVTGESDVFYAFTGDIHSKLPDLKNYITKDEGERAGRFHFDRDRDTYTACHAVLRLILSERLNTSPHAISFKNGKYNKPELEDSSLNFNITHTHNAFAIAISDRECVGIDLERINQGMEFHSIMRNYFSPGERDFILGSQSDKRNRFFLLWTRKEAFLKALGIGIIDDLAQVEVYGKHNYIKYESLGNSILNPVFKEFYIYSMRLQDYFLSIAFNRKEKINIYQLDNNNITTYMTKI